MTEIVKRLKAISQDQDITQRELAKRMDTTETSVSRWFNGSRTPNAKNIEQDVTIRYRNNDGSIVATIPVRYIKIGAPRQVSDEQREVLAERLRAMREKQSV